MTRGGPAQAPVPVERRREPLGRDRTPIRDPERGWLFVKSLWRLLGLVVLPLLLVVSGPIQPGAHAEDGYVYGPVSDPVTLKLQRVKFWWFECDVVGVWKSASGQHYLSVSGGCSRGALADNEDGYLYADVPNCGRPWAYLGNLDEKDETGSFSNVNMTPSGGGGSTGTGCGAPTQLCLATVSPQENPDLSNGVGETRCAAWNVGAPPQENDPYYNSGQAGCSLWNPLEPWVSAPVATSVSGGWAWRQTVVFSIPDYSTGSGTGPGEPMGGGDVWPYAYARTATGVQMARTPTYVSGGGDGSVNGWKSLAFTGNDGSWKHVNQVTMTLTGPTKTGVAGSGAPDILLRTAGYYWWRDFNVGTLGTGSVGNSYTTKPTLAGIRSGVPGTYVAYNDPAYCHFAWGEKIWTGSALAEANPAGPITERGGSTPPPPVVVVTTPPVIHVGPGAECPPSADACIDPDADNPDAGEPSVPDPEGESCDFSITDPSTWGGQLICALVSVAKMIVEAIVSVVDAIADLLGDLLELLMSLFVPDAGAITDSLASLRSSLEDGAMGDWTGATSDAFSPSGSGPGCAGPSFDLTSLGVPTVEDLRPFDACSTAAAQAASIVRMVATVTIGLSGGFFMIRLLCGALGINVPSPMQRREAGQ